MCVEQEDSAEPGAGVSCVPRLAFSWEMCLRCSVGRVTLKMYSKNKVQLTCKRCRYKYHNITEPLRIESRFLLDYLNTKLNKIKTRDKKNYRNDLCLERKWETSQES